MRVQMSQACRQQLYRPFKPGELCDGAQRNSFIRQQQDER
jgi:hypothetical protein